MRALPTPSGNEDASISATLHGVSGSASRTASTRENAPENATLRSSSSRETTDDDDANSPPTQPPTDASNAHILRSPSSQLAQWLQAQRASVVRGDSTLSQRTINVILNSTEPTRLNHTEATAGPPPVIFRVIQGPPTDAPSRRVDLSIDTTATPATTNTLALAVAGEPTAHSPPSRASSPASSSLTSSDDDEPPRDDTSMFDDFRTLFRRAHHSLPFIALFLVYFAVQHAVAIATLVIGSVAIAGLDQRLRTQVALKENASRVQLWGIIAMSVVDTVVISMLDGEINPLRHLLRKIEVADGAAILEVLWLVLVNDFIVRLWSLALKAVVAAVNSEAILCGRRRRISVSGVAPDLDNDDAERGRRRKSSHSMVSFHRRKRKLYAIIELASIFFRSLLAGVPWCTYYQLCSSKFIADVFTFVYIFGKGLVLGNQGRQLFKLTLSFVTLGLEHATYVTRAELVENGCPDCSICYEPMQVPVKLSCSHMFCEECVMEWFDRERSCPLCRAAIAAPSLRPADNIKPQFLDGSTSLFPQLF